MSKTFNAIQRRSIQAAYFRGLSPAEVTDHINNLSTTKKLKQKFTISQIAAAKRYCVDW